MQNLSILATKEYKPIVKKCISIVLNPYPNQKGIFAYDTTSKFMFEFSSMESVMDVDDGRFIIFDGNVIYLNYTDGYIKINFGSLIDLQMFADMMGY